MLQFGQPAPGLSHALRPTVFGLALDADGRLACVRVERGDRSYHDLPGGAVDGVETEPEALVREFLEETGLTVRPGVRFAEAAQFFLKSDGRPLNNTGGFWTVEVVTHDPWAKVEDDHTLVWLPVQDALRSLRHDAHAWAVATWLRGATDRT